MSKKKKDYIELIISIARMLLDQDDVDVTFSQSLDEESLIIVAKKNLYVGGQFTNTPIK